MPRDDLKIDINAYGKTGGMPPPADMDCATVLEDWTNRVANLPSEIIFMQEEIAEKDRLLQDCLQVIQKNDHAIQKHIKEKGSNTPNPSEVGLRKKIEDAYKSAMTLQKDKLELSLKTRRIIDKHTRYLDKQIKILADKGELKDADMDGLPSLLNPPPQPARAEPTATAIAQAGNSAITAQRRGVQVPPQALAHQSLGKPALFTPSTPGAIIAHNQPARESSLGASNKRARLTSNAALPSSSSGLARHSSALPGTPRAGTPGTVRSGSQVPKTSMVSKKNPLGSRQSGVLRTKKHTKSTLGRVKRAGRNSPSLNDSELSESGSGEEEEEQLRNPDLIDLDDEEENNRVYCLCQKVSSGNMVGCDEDACKYEWFHWECVGLKSEPPGKWICPACTEEALKKK